MSHSIGNSFIGTICSRIKAIATGIFAWLKSLIWHTPPQPAVTTPPLPASSSTIVATAVLPPVPLGDEQFRQEVPEPSPRSLHRSGRSSFDRVEEKTSLAAQPLEKIGVAAAPSVEEIIQLEAKLSVREASFVALAFIQRNILFDSVENQSERIFTETALSYVLKSGKNWAARPPHEFTSQVGNCGFALYDKSVATLAGFHKRLEDLRTKLEPCGMILESGKTVLGAVRSKTDWKLFRSDGSKVTVERFEKWDALQHVINKHFPKSENFKVTTLQKAKNRH